MLKLALILAVLPALALARDTQHDIAFTACNEGGPVPEWASINGCNTTSCVIVNGATITFGAGLVVSVPAQTLTTRVAAQWAIINSDLVLQPEVINGCNSFVGGCPLEVGTERELSNSFEVQASISNISPNIEFIMTNEAGERIVCVRTAVRLISA